MKWMINNLALNQNEEPGSYWATLDMFVIAQSFSYQHPVLSV